MRYEPALAERIAEAGIAVCPTIYQGIGKYAADPGFKPTPDQQAFYDSRQQRYETVQALVKQGVRIIAGSDAGAPHVRFGDFPGDVAILGTGTGLPAAYVLKTATTLAAETLGLAGETGALAPGLSADLLGVQGDPLADLSALTRPLLVVAQGRVVNDRFALRVDGRRPVLASASGTAECSRLSRPGGIAGGGRHPEVRRGPDLTEPVSANRIQATRPRGRVGSHEA